MTISTMNIWRFYASFSPSVSVRSHAQCPYSSQWKKDSRSISPQFKALVDINNIHSSCRLCMATADHKYHLPSGPYGPERTYARMQLENEAKRRELA